MIDVLLLDIGGTNIRYAYAEKDSLEFTNSNKKSAFCTSLRDYLSVTNLNTVIHFTDLYCIETSFILH